MKDLSIIIPMYNAERYIGKCIKSILLQNLPEDKYEIIVVNDGSTDGSVPTVSLLAKRYSQIRLISQVNSGQSAARNRGIEEALGRYISFVDADDFLLDNSLLSVYELIKNAYAPDLITYGMIGGNPEKIDYVFIEKPVFKAEPPVRGMDYISEHNYNNSPCYYFISKKFLDKIGLRFANGKLCEDGMFTMTALLNADSVVNTNAKVYYYAVRGDSTTTTKDIARLSDLIEGFKFAISYISDLIVSKKGAMPVRCAKRVLTRRDSYIFFCLLRIMRCGNVQQAKWMISDLLEKDLYPIKYFIGEDYNGWTFKLLNILINNKMLYYSACVLCSITNALIKLIKS